MFVEMHRFLIFFFNLNLNQLPAAAKKGLKNGASQQTFCPSHFERALTIVSLSFSDFLLVGT